MPDFPPSAKRGGSTYISHLLCLTVSALPVSAGGSSKQEKRWRKDGREPPFEALSKRQEAGPIRRKCRRAVLQASPLRSRRSPRSAVSAPLRKQCCALDRPGAKRRALRLHVPPGVPVPRRQSTPSVGSEHTSYESWPRPSQTVAQQGPPYPSASRVIFHLSQTRRRCRSGSWHAVSTLSGANTPAIGICRSKI
jgi:hypothetical protein